MSVDNTILYLYTIKILYLLGKYVSSLQGHHQALQEDRVKSRIIIQFLDRSSWRAWWWHVFICYNTSPDDDLVRSKHVALTNILFLLYVNKVLCYWPKHCIYML